MSSATSDRVPAPSMGCMGIRCASRVLPMLWRRQLHLHRERVGATVELDDGRRFLVYRDTSSSAPDPPSPETGDYDDDDDDEVVMLAVWFRLWAVPPGAPVRAWLFERESILNTILFAGCAGYRTKLWTVNRQTHDYAGFYTWRGRASAERYQRYITTILRPLSVHGTVGGHIDDAGSPPSWRVDGPLASTAEAAEAAQAGR